MTKNRKPVAVYLFGGEGTGWALDADVETTRQSLRAIPEQVRLTGLSEAEIVHSVWEYPLLHMDPALLDGKRIVCHICNDIMRTYEDPCMVAAGETLGLWVAISRKGEDEIKRLGFMADYIPYSVDTSIFSETLPAGKRRTLKERYGLPLDAFVISSFMRDSSASDLQRPKQQKGTELFAAVAVELKRRGYPVHILLAGPRRHWLRKKLQQNGVPFTFVGKQIEEDDNHVNILNPGQINQLYHISDLHLVTSRWEGGPRAVLEAAATRTPILCTPVGMAPDILVPECLFSDFDEVVDKISRQIENGPDRLQLDRHYACIQQHHTPAANIERFRRLYSAIEEVPRFDKRKIVWQRNRHACVPMEQPLGRRAILLLSGLFRKKKRARVKIGLWHEYHKPPYGGGNQFMMALRKALQEQGAAVVVNKFQDDIDVHLCNSAWFDTERFLSKTRRKKIRMIHRIDGPVTLYRGLGSQEDDRIFELNERFADATVFQSAYCFFQSSDLGYRAVSPIVIHNAVDGDIFHPRGRRRYDGSDKLRLISTAWSDNPRKGGPLYKWLDENLDFSRFEYTFVGRVQQQFRNIRYIAPQKSGKLAEILRQHDIYITASQHEPCSNALLEALACGLPALYRNDGGNPELVSFGGLPFEGEEDILGQLDRLAAHYASFQSLIYVKPIDEIARRYIDLAKQIVAHRGR